MNEIEEKGFAIVPNVLPGGRAEELCQHLAAVSENEASSVRAGKAFGIRNLLEVVPATRSLANDPLLRSLVDPVLGEKAKVVRGVYLDKHRDANWKVAWHQDLTIAVKHFVDVKGYGPWSVKAGIQHVQPPVKVLEEMLAVRVHLDDADEENGALQVLPGTHKHGRLGSEDILKLRMALASVTCLVKRGDVVLMRPLLLHASSQAVTPTRRRVLHFEYSAAELAPGLEWYES